MIDVSYQNNSKDDKYVSIYDFQCYADNTDCEQNYSVVDSSSLNANLSSGRKTSYKIAFVVPQDAQSIELEYETSIWTGHKEIIKLQQNIDFKGIRKGALIFYVANPCSA